MKPIRMRRVTPFNSQPHARLTDQQAKQAHHSYPFNSQPHTRLTGRKSQSAAKSELFQFTASYGADLLAIVIPAICFSFQFTASYEADRCTRWSSAA